MYRIGLKMKKAFTMIELIFVIVVIGILAAVIMPRTGSNKLHEAATQVLSHIRYTQHLAMVDDKFVENNDTWFRSNWQIEFRSGTTFVDYRIYTDKDQNGNVDIINNEAAIDPLSKEPLNSASKITDLTKFRIGQVIFSDNCKGNGTGKELSFDFLGRPYKYITETEPDTSNIYEHLLTSNCEITFKDSEDNVTIRVHPETGYACILDGANCI